jgi:hypothetical protein
MSLPADHPTAEAALGIALGACKTDEERAAAMSIFAMLHPKSLPSCGVCAAGMAWDACPVHGTAAGITVDSLRLFARAMEGHASNEDVAALRQFADALRALASTDHEPSVRADIIEAARVIYDGSWKRG